MILIFFRQNDKSRTDYDLYFVGYFYEDNYGVNISNLTLNSIHSIHDGIKWARFNKPETKNNLGYGIAYLNQYGDNFYDDIPILLLLKKKN